MPEMKHPDGDVRVIPNALTEKYLARGWEPVVASKRPRRTPEVEQITDPEEQA